MNTFGRFFRIAISGESHSPFITVEIDGVPVGIPLSEKDFSFDLARRKGGRKGTTPRKESDIPQIIRGTLDGLTTGTTLKIAFANENISPKDYCEFASKPRPGHADFVRMIKYGTENLSSGGGMFSGRMTLPLVAAGTIAKKIITPMTVRARLTEAGGFVFPADCNDYSCTSKGPLNISEFMHIIDKAATDGDSIGGIVECVCKDVPAGLGDPFFDSMESMISHIAFSVPGIRGIEFGDGFAAARMRGSEHNDPICDIAGHTSKNGAGGINGGIANGNPLVFRVAVKPTSSIAKAQTSINLSTGRMEELKIKGRHDVCFALRVPVVIESIAAIYLADASLALRSDLL